MVHACFLRMILFLVAFVAQASSMQRDRNSRGFLTIEIDAMASGLTNMSTPQTHADNSTMRCNCPDLQHASSVGEVSSATSKFKDVMFIIIFNEPYFDVTSFLADLYMPYTSKLLFCSKHHPPTKLPVGTAFLQVEDMGGVIDGDNTQYECLRQALLDQRFVSSDIKGFAVAADDAFIDWKNLANHNLESLGMYTTDTFQYHFSLERPDQENSPAMQWANLVPYGYKASKATFDELQQVKDSWARPYFKTTPLLTKTFTWNHADFFYLPAKLKDPFVQLSSVFAKHKVYFELAVPTMFQMLSQVYNIPIGDIPGFIVDVNIDYTLRVKKLTRLWKGDRSEFWKNQDMFAEAGASGATWWHPVKLSLLRGNPERQMSFCQTTTQCRSS